MQENEKSKQKKEKKCTKQHSNHKYEICLMEMI